MKTKSFFRNVWCFCVMICMVPGVQAIGAEAFVIAGNGRAKATVAILENSGRLAEEAVWDLRRVMGVMCGDPLKAGEALSQEPVIVVGLASEWALLTKDTGPEERLKAASPESFLLLSRPGKLLILGKDSNGASHGVYTLLHDLGCRWYFIAKEWEVIPRRETVSVCVDRVEGPVMRMRKINSGMGQGGLSRTLFEDWQRRNRMGSAYGKAGINHAYANFVPASLFKEHPDYFAWVSPDGKMPGTIQNGLQPCTTRPEVVKLFTEGALSILRKRKETDPANTLLLSVSPNDNTGNLCRCDKCREVGSYTDCALLLANQVAEAIRGEFPTTLVGFMAYGRVSPPPNSGHNIKVNPNVIVSMATAYTWNTFSLEMLRRWPASVRHLIIRDYYSIGSWGGERPDYTGPKIRELSRDIKQWHQQGIEGIEAEMCHSWASCGHRFWASSELMWNPALTEQSIKDDFYTNCWGEAAVPMRRYYERWESGQAASPRVMGLSFQDLAEATRLARTPEVLARVNLMTLYLHQFHLLTETEKIAEECRLQNLSEEETQARVETYCEEGNSLTYRWKDAYLLPIQPKVYQMTRPYSGYTPAEVAAILDRDVAFYQRAANPLVETGGVPFSADLVPVQDRAMLQSLDSSEHVEGRLGSACYVFRAKRNETVDLVCEMTAAKPAAPAPVRDQTSTPSKAIRAPVVEDKEEVGDAPAAGVQEVRQGRVELWSLGNDGSERRLVEYQSIVIHERSSALRFAVPQDGLYMLSAKIGRGKPVQVKVVNRPVSIIADMKTTKDISPLSQVSKNERGVKPFSVYYFFVPAGTRYFTFQLLRLKSARPLAFKVTTAAGQVVKEESASKDSEWLIKVPPTMDGCIWKLWFNADGFIRLGFDGIPPYVSTHPRALLIPRECARERTGK